MSLRILGDHLRMETHKNMRLENQITMMELEMKRIEWKMKETVVQRIKRKMNRIKTNLTRSIETSLGRRASRKAKEVVMVMMTAALVAPIAAALMMTVHPVMKKIAMTVIQTQK